MPHPNKLPTLLRNIASSKSMSKYHTTVNLNKNNDNKTNLTRQITIETISITQQKGY